MSLEDGDFEIEGVTDDQLLIMMELKKQLTFMRSIEELIKKGLIRMLPKLDEHGVFQVSYVADTFYDEMFNTMLNEHNSPINRLGMEKLLEGDDK